MEQDKNERYTAVNAKLVLTIIPIVMLMILIFFTLTRNEIVELSKDKLALQTENCSEDINVWSEQIINELNIYKNVIEQTEVDDDGALEILKTSCDKNVAYPFGLYIGDENGVYLDGSGWDPYAEGEDFVVTERNWYIEGKEHENFTFGEPYVDAMTGDVCVSATSQINYKPAFSIISTDIYLSYASKLVTDVTQGNIENAFCISGDSRIILANSDSDKIGLDLDEYKDSQLYNNINALLNDPKDGQYKVTSEKGSYYIDIVKLKTTDWYLVTCISLKEILKDMRHLEALMLIVAAIASVILIFMTIKISRQMNYIKNKARTDLLTGLLNRSGFRETVKELLNSNPQQGVMIIIDMDNFKLINDQLGHPEGDIVLKSFSGVLEGYFNRNKDICARIGGDEFAVFVGRNIDKDEAKAMLKKFITVFHDTFDEKYPRQELSISIGAVFVKDSDSEYEPLYKRADKHLYDVKRNGKNGFEIE